MRLAGGGTLQVVVLDIRFPTLPVAELQRHQACVNALAWAPHSSCHICTAGDDSQALIWDLSSMSQSMDQGLGASDLLLFSGFSGFKGRKMFSERSSGTSPP